MKRRDTPGVSGGRRWVTVPPPSCWHVRCNGRDRVAWRFPNGRAQFVPHPDHELAEFALMDRECQCHMMTQIRLLHGSTHAQTLVGTPDVDLGLLIDLNFIEDRRVSDIMFPGVKKFPFSHEIRERFYDNCKIVGAGNYLQQLHTNVMRAVRGR